MSGFWVLLMFILASSIPAIIVYVWYRAAHYPFSPVRFLVILLIGATAFFPALFLQNIFPREIVVTGRWTLLSHVFLRIALSEELSRLLVLFAYFKISRLIDPLGHISADKGGALNHGEKDFSPYTAATIGNDHEVILGTAAGLVAGLGLAILESAAYGASATGIILFRLFTASPLHAACGARVGSSAVLFRLHPARAFFRFLSAVVIHGFYNYMIVLSGLPSFAAVFIAISALVSSIQSIRSGMSKNQSL